MVNVNNISDAIVRELQEYSQLVSSEVEKGSLEVAKDTVKELKAISPKRPGSGRYAKSWTYRKQGSIYTIYNKDYYQLTHLLEKGHAKIGGGRVAGKVHIAKAEENAVNKFIEVLERSLRND